MAKTLITGASGALGNLVAQQLAKLLPVSEIAAMARKPEALKPLAQQGIEVRQGDYDDPASLAKALKGIEQVYFVSGPDITRREKQQETFVKAALQAGVRHVAYTSFQRNNDAPDSPLAPIAKAHLQTEAQLLASGMQTSLLRHNLYAEVLPLFLGEAVLNAKTIFFPAGDGKASFVTRADLALAGARLLAAHLQESRSYQFSNITSWGFADIARELGELIGSEVRYVSPSLAEFQSALQGFGVPPAAIGISVAFAQAIQQGEMECPASDLPRFLGREPVSLRHWLAEFYKQ